MYPDSYWNYRVVRFESEFEGEVEVYYQIHEVHYEHDKIVSWTEEPVPAGGESLYELECDIRTQLTAITRGVLSAEELPGYSKTVRVQ